MPIQSISYATNAMFANLMVSTSPERQYINNVAYDVIPPNIATVINVTSCNSLALNEKKHCCKFTCMIPCKLQFTVENRVMNNTALATKPE